MKNVVTYEITIIRLGSDTIEPGGIKRQISISRDYPEQYNEALFLDETQRAWRALRKLPDHGRDRT